MSNKRQTWGKYHTWHPSEVLHPSNLEELRQILAKARSKHSKIRPIGSSHTMNTLCATSEIQIETDKLCRVLFIDKQRLKVKTEAGIKIYKLLECLAKEGLTLPNQGYIVEQAIAGAVATATHGSGRTGTLSSFVEEIELLDANGTLHTLTPSSDEHLFSAALVNLGCLGIVYSLTLTCIPLEKLNLAKVRSSLPRTLEQLDTLLQTNDYFQFVIDPYSDSVITWLYHKTQEGLKNRLSYKIRWLANKMLAYIAFDLKLYPWWLIPQIIKIYMKISTMKCCIDYSCNLLSPADDGHYVEEEIAIPFEKFKEALSATRQIIDRFGQQKKRFVAVILIRFANAEKYGYLSPAIGRQTAYISLITIAKEGYKDLFQEFETALYAFQGRPHWGKINFLTRQKVAELYGPNYELFREAKQTLDPAGIFSNEHIDRLFGEKDSTQ